MGFENYKYIEETLRKNEKKYDTDTLKLLKVTELFKLGEYKKAKIIIDDILEQYLIEHKKVSIRALTFNTLIKFSFLFGRFDKVFKVIEKENIEFLDSEQDFFYIEVINHYYEFVKSNKSYPVEELKNKADNNTKKSVLYYICFLIFKNEIDAKDFLKMSIKEEPLNMSSIYELINLGEEIDVKSLKFAFELNIELFNKINFNEDKKNIGAISETSNLEIFTVCGGDSIGGSCYVISFDTTKIMVDAGAIISRDDILSYPDFEVLEEKYKNIFTDIEYFLITHGHLDHCGAILEIYKRNPKIKMLMTEETREIIRANLTSSKLTCQEEIELDTCLKMAVVVGFRQALKVKCKDNTFMDIEFFRAGHILGASSIYINSKGVGVFVTGDYCLYNQETVEGMDIPKNYKIDLLVTENTYGNKIEGEASRNYEQKKFAYTVKSALKNGKKILIPSFSIGRAQEIISILRKQLNTLENERIYIDGMVIKINKIYEKFLKVEFAGTNIYTFDERLYDSKKDFINQEILNNKSCVVASSGMLQKDSAVMEYAKKFFERKDCVCILTGYQAEDTIGRSLKSQMNIEGDRYISIDGNLMKIKCELEEANLSAHCTIEEILTLISKIKPKKVLLVHGSSGENQSYIYKILNKCNGLQVVQSKNRTSINI